MQRLSIRTCGLDGAEALSKASQPSLSTQYQASSLSAPTGGLYNSSSSSVVTTNSVERRPSRTPAPKWQYSAYLLSPLYSHSDFHTLFPEWLALTSDSASSKKQFVTQKLATLTV